ncbi:MAG: response regulator [Alphaproteobacteria bacterium]|jgi:DNA-binding response OmpR family regulator|nr:response regulator [Alphaproteobacteria bacterium]MDP6873283.1 response regulator [Alphaproteobacteria bacterium]
MDKTILVAEDEPFIVESLTFLLSREGHTVEAVADGGEVIAAMHRMRPDLLILDIMMPSSNGFDILQKIRVTPNLQATPVLALTAKGQEADRRRMLELGANDFMTKPFSNVDLVAKVGDLLAGAEGKAG